MLRIWTRRSPGSRTTASILGEFSLTVVLYGWGDPGKAKKGGSRRGEDLRQSRSVTDSRDIQRAERIPIDLSGQSAPSISGALGCSAATMPICHLCMRRPSGRSGTSISGASTWLCSRRTSARHIYFNVYEGDRFGALIFGAPGAGKSVLANLLDRPLAEGRAVHVHSRSGRQLPTDHSQTRRLVRPDAVRG